jgi:hypothetical protein
MSGKMAQVKELDAITVNSNNVVGVIEWGILMRKPGVGLLT